MSDHTDHGEESHHPNEGSDESGNTGENRVDKIRELLFGEQMTGYEARFQALEARLIAEVESLRRSVEDSVAELRSQAEDRSNSIEHASVARDQLAASLERLAHELRH